MTLALGILIVVAAVSGAVGAILFMRRRHRRGATSPTAPAHPECSASLRPGSRSRGIRPLPRLHELRRVAERCRGRALGHSPAVRNGPVPTVTCACQTPRRARVLRTVRRAAGSPRMEDGTASDTISPWGLALFRTLKRSGPRPGRGGRLREVARPDIPTARRHAAMSCTAPPDRPHVDLDRPLPDRRGRASRSCCSSPTAPSSQGRRRCSSARRPPSSPSHCSPLRALDNPCRGVRALEPAAMEQSLVILDGHDRRWATRRAPMRL